MRILRVKLRRRREIFKGFRGLNCAAGAKKIGYFAIPKGIWLPKSSKNWGPGKIWSAKPENPPLLKREIFEKGGVFGSGLY